jgi:hypothetical protein
MSLRNKVKEGTHQNAGTGEPKARSVDVRQISSKDVDRVLDNAIAREKRYFRLTEGQRRAAR